MYLELQKRLADHLRALLQAKYDIQQPNIPLEIPPDLQFGELATPIAFELARKLRKAPKIIAQEIVAALGSLPGFSSFEVAGAGYINAHLDRPPPSAPLQRRPFAPLQVAMRSSSTPASIPTRPPTSATSATPSSVTPSSVFSAPPAKESMSRTTSTTPASRSPTSSSDLSIWKTNPSLMSANWSPHTGTAPPAQLAPQQAASTSTAGTSTPAPPSGTSRGRKKKRPPAKSFVTPPSTNSNRATTTPLR